MLQIVGGYDPREIMGYEVAKFSARRRTTKPVNIMALRENALRSLGLYKRPHEMRDGRLWDVISQAPMSTQFANSRFLLPWLPWLREATWALFADFSDMLFQADPAELFALADKRYAVMVAKHHHVPKTTVKMDGQAQMAYYRKNWSSVVLWNLEHEANRALTIDMVNTLPGRDLHRFCWLEDDLIGELPFVWNYLVGQDHPNGQPPKLLHYTEGAPFMPGYEDGPWADVWHAEHEVMLSQRSGSPLE